MVGLVLAVVVFAPARWLAAAVQQLTDDRVRLLAPRGSVWQGSAQLVLSGGEGSHDAMTLPSQLTWRIHPTWRGVTAEVMTDCCTPKALNLQLMPAGWGGLRLALSNGQSEWPAGLLAGLGTPWNTIQPKGQLVASTQGFQAEWVQGRLSLAGRMQLDATQMSSRLSTLQPLGSYRFTLLGGAPSTLQLETLEGRLQLTGQGQWVGQRLRFGGAASATPESIEALSNLLNIIGRRDGARAIIKVG